MRRFKTIRLVAVFALLLVFATSAYAFTASNIVQVSNAGSGSGNISGYAVTNISYEVTDGSIRGVHFSIQGNENPGVIPANLQLVFVNGSGMTYGGGGAGSACYQTDPGNITRMFCSVNEGIANVTGLTVTAWN